MLTEHELQTPSGSIHYVEGPPSGVPMVLIHGNYSNWHSLMAMMPSLVLRYHLFAPDLRGHGLSSWTPGAYSLQDDLGDIRALLSERVAKPALLVGHSLGGMLALMAAAAVPEQVRAVVAVDPPLFYLTDDVVRKDALNQYFRKLRELLSTVSSDAEMLAGLSKLLPKLDPLTLRRRVQQFKHFDPERLTWFIDDRARAALQLQDFLPRIAAPVLLIQGNPALGGMLDDPTAKTAASLIADCIHLYQADVGHDIRETQPTRLAQLVSGFAEMF